MRVLNACHANKRIVQFVLTLHHALHVHRDSTNPMEHVPLVHRDVQSAMYQHVRIVSMATT